MTRKFTKLLLDRVEDGLYDKDYVIKAFCSYMSEDDVKDMMEVNELLDNEDLEEEEDE